MEKSDFKPESGFELALKTTPQQAASKPDVLPVSVSMDRELEQVLEQARARIIVVGCGGAGCNTVARIMEVGIRGADTIAVNTDAQDLLYTTADRKVLIGRDVTYGLGAGNDPEKGEKAAREDENLLKEQVHGADMVFVTLSLIHISEPTRPY